ncbi:predicted protein [Phaeodactylum tricornutum CCAP 1055/1]|uniref:Uncharacterized protein n=2 Tax=Phaeodactylum tricornutum TaxID=2850 RepID=B7FZY1_PHATC|nr:predicted protein [Phaeodactylum tricornutum CCAP 1055/1]EEC47790.1 predicted protein [Phaeodactylum tricornutum CCAP 1055/1]|eukprot:XP_002180382.1 predicted protein [Phaeodactylum tricornutum CCAP 1055/1]
MRLVIVILGIVCLAHRAAPFTSLGASRGLQARRAFRLREKQSDNDTDPSTIDDDGLRVEKVEDPERRNLIINAVGAGLLLSSGVASAQLYVSQVYTPGGFQRLPSMQFVAALGDPNAREGMGADQWGIWRDDPGPRGVWLRNFDKLEQADYVAPVGWKFDTADWWLEEHGIIMEAPQFPVPAGRYLVTGGRMVTTGLTIGADGSWKLDEGKLYDVTHLPCRSARYRPNDGGGSPYTAKGSDFPVIPGAEMPKVPGCDKQDYAVLFLVGKAT